MKIRKKYSNEIANIVKTNLANFGWQCSFEEDYGLFIFDLKVNSNIKSIRSFFRITESALVFYGISPIQANTKDPEIMKELGEFFCRANFGLDIGSFEFDFIDGEIRYKSFIDCDGGMLPSDQVIKNAICYTVAMYERYAPGITAILFGGKTAESAISLCETVVDGLNDDTEKVYC